MLKSLEEADFDVKDVTTDILSKAKSISIRESKEYPILWDYQKEKYCGVRIYSCDADCDNCHCATYN